ncbi:MAG: Hsp20/alpha crystallin family protein [Candidatus Nanoarchaeia archaeon]
MGFFDDDPFEDIVREFFRGRPVRRNQFIRGEEEDRESDYIEDKNAVYLIFELPGYNKKDVSIIIKGKNLEINAKKTNQEDMQDYLHKKLKHGFSIQKQLPDYVDKNKIDYTMKNGVLEIVLKKRRKDG